MHKGALSNFGARGTNQVQSTGHPPNSIYTTVQLSRTTRNGKTQGGST